MLTALKVSRSDIALLLLRLFCGGYLCWMGYDKLTDSGFSAALPSLLSGWALRNPIFFYQDFLNVIAVPQSSLLAVLIPWLELGCGALLIGGLWVRGAASVLILLMLNYGMATQHLAPQNLGLHLAFLVMGCAIWLGDAGRVLGLDQLLAWGLNRSQRRLSEAHSDKVRPKGSKKSKTSSALSAKQIQKAFAKLRGG